MRISILRRMDEVAKPNSFVIVPMAREASGKIVHNFSMLEVNRKVLERHLEFGYLVYSANHNNTLKQRYFISCIILGLPVPKRSFSLSRNFREFSIHSVS